MARINCPRCGKEHELDEMELGFDRPDQFIEVPRRQRGKRIDAGDDLCRIDDRYYIRGFVEIPRTDSKDTFAFGVWAEVGRKGLIDT